MFPSGSPFPPSKTSFGPPGIHFLSLVVCLTMYFFFSLRRHGAITHSAVTTGWAAMSHSALVLSESIQALIYQRKECLESLGAWCLAYCAIEGEGEPAFLTDLDD